MNVELLKELTEAHGTSGYEDEIRAIVRRELDGICEITADAMGNLICLKRGNGAKKLMLAAAAMALATTAMAAYPEKPITLVVPFAAGGPTDKVARDLAEVLRKHLNNQTVVIENVGGAGGTLGAGQVAGAEADGYTILLHHIGMATSATLYRQLPYDTLAAFDYVGLVSDVAMTVVARPSLASSGCRLATNHHLTTPSVRTRTRTPMLS